MVLVGAFGFVGAEILIDGHPWRLVSDSDVGHHWVHDEFPDRGYWVLTSSEVRAYHMMVGINMLDDLNFYPTCDESVPYTDKTPLYGGWTVKKNHATGSEFSVSWSDPPAKIPVGQEYRAVIAFSTDCQKMQKRDWQREVIPMGDTEGREQDREPYYFDYCPWCVYGTVSTYSKWGRRQRGMQMW